MAWEVPPKGDIPLWAMCDYIADWSEKKSNMAKGNPARGRVSFVESVA